MRKKVVLSIAGSDSGGGAGIQADLSVFSSFGVHGVSAITALTAQNSTGVTGICPVPPSFVSAQIEAVASDMRIAAWKTGMLLSESIIRAVAREAGSSGLLSRAPLVLDPVMASHSGEMLSAGRFAGALRRRLLPRALVLTPNIPEAEILSGRRARTIRGAEDAARAILDLGPRYVLIKGGHRKGRIINLLAGPDGINRFEKKRIRTRNTHGTGCRLSAAITACLALGLTVEDAVLAAIEDLHRALLRSYRTGRGPGTPNHLRDHLR